jgi:hypothetical protein
LNYKVLSPWGEVESVPTTGILPRVKDLNGRTIGLFSFFKQVGPPLMKEIERQLKEKFPTTRFSHYQYPIHSVEIAKDDNYRAPFEEWLNGVDTVITGHGD